MPRLRLRHLFLPCEQQLGCGCIAGTLLYVVIAGLDPAIHTASAKSTCACCLTRHLSMDHRVKPGGDEKK